MKITKRIIFTAFFYFYATISYAQIPSNNLIELGSQLFKAAIGGVKNKIEKEESNGNSSNSPEYEKFVKTGNKFIQSIHWPTENKLGFKTLSIGDIINISDKSIVGKAAYVTEIFPPGYFYSDLALFICQIQIGSPMAECKLENNSNNKQAMQIGTAFGTSVGVKIDAVLAEMPSEKQVQNNIFGKSKIFTINISSYERSMDNRLMGAVAANAKKYFSEKFQMQPKVIHQKQTNNKKNKDKKALADCKKLNTKPRISWTQADIYKSKLCELQLVAEIGNASISTNIVNYVWDTKDGAYKVEIRDEKTTNKLPGAMPYTYKTNIVIGLKNAETLLNQFIQDMQTIANEKSKQETIKNTQDF